MFKSYILGLPAKSEGSHRSPVRVQRPPWRFGTEKPALFGTSSTSLCQKLIAFVESVFLDLSIFFLPKYKDSIWHNHCLKHWDYHGSRNHFHDLPKWRQHYCLKYYCLKHWDYHVSRMNFHVQCSMLHDQYFHWGPLHRMEVGRLHSFEQSDGKPWLCDSLPRAIRINSWNFLVHFLLIGWSFAASQNWHEQLMSNKSKRATKFQLFS